MTVATDPGPPTLLDALAALRPGERPAALRAAGDPDAALLALSADVQRLVSAEAGRALVLADLLAGLADELGGPASRIEVRSVRAMALAYAGRFDDALIACEEGVALAEETGMPVAAARARLGAVHPLASLGRYAEALTAARAAREVFAGAGETDLEARAEINLGAVHEMADDPRAAIACYDRAASLLDGDPVTLGQLDSNRGLALIALDDYVGAETAFTAAVERFDREGLGWAAAVAEENLAYLAVRQGRLAAAMRHFERGRRYLEEDDAPVHLARLMADQADAFAAIGLPEQALAAWQEVIPVLEERGLAAEAVQARVGAGRLLLRAGRMNDAAAMLDAAAAEASALGLALPLARIMALRAELALATGNTTEAAALAVNAATALADRPAETLAAIETLARAALAEGNPRAALAEIETVMPVATALDLPPALADLHHLKGKALLAAGDAVSALEAFRTAMREMERVRGALQAERFRAAWLGNRLGLYEDAVAVALGQGEAGIAEAFGWIEAGKGRALLDALGGEAALDIAPDASDPAERRLLAERAALRAELEWLYSDDTAGDGERPAERRATIRRIEADLAALEDRLAAAGGLAGLYARPSSLAETMALLPDGTALIDYFAAGGRMLAVVVANGRAAAFADLCPVETVEELRTWFAFQVNRALAAGPDALATPRGERMTADACRVLERLHDLLIAPLLPAIGGATRLIVAPHGPLHALPVRAFRDGEHHLIERFEIATVPSASVLAHLSGAEPNDAGIALVAGVADAAAPRITEEAAAVAALLPGARVLIDGAATVAAVGEAARAAGTIHLACHGRFDPDAPQASGLKLADRWLTAREIPALALRARLVTLSGCETGRSAVTGADDLAGLIRAFLAAGASSLIYSLWLADDAATTELMSSLYRYMKEGQSAVSALRSAQLELLARYPHPAFWAAFVYGGTP